MNPPNITLRASRKMIHGAFVLGLLVCFAFCSCRKKPPSPSPQSASEPVPSAAQPDGGSPAGPQSAAGELSSEPASPKKSGEPANPKEVRAAFDKYSKNIGGPPGSWEELIEGKLLKGVPMGNDGKPLDFTAYQEYLGRGGK